MLVKTDLTIRQLIENENYVIIPDTNVLLNMYRYAPDYTEFAYDCFSAVKNHLVLPATVRHEYGKHCRGLFSKMEKRSKYASEETKRQIAMAKQKIVDSCNALERLKFPDVEELKNSLSEAMDKVKKVFDDFFDYRQAIGVAESSWGGEDKLMDLIADIEASGNILKDISYEDVFCWTLECEKRYKNSTPPGYRDAKSKENEGLSKYADFFIWSEILGYAKASQKNVIFVTDDAKDDWWEKILNKRQFHHFLIEEFSSTGQQLIPLNSLELYDEISMAYSIEKPDIVYIALNMTDNEYCNDVKDVVFDKIEDQLVCNLQDYVETESSHIGSEGLDEILLDDWEFDSFSRIETSDSFATYNFRYIVTLEGTSYDYWGRDDDTREIIRSYGTDHVFKGWIDVCVERKADLFINFLEDDSFEDVRIVGYRIAEVSYHDRIDSFDEEPSYSVCPDCGLAITLSNDAGTGFCIDCQRKRDDS